MRWRQKPKAKAIDTDHSILRFSKWKGWKRSKERRDLRVEGAGVNLRCLVANVAWFLHMAVESVANHLHFSILQVWRLFEPPALKLALTLTLSLYICMPIPIPDLPFSPLTIAYCVAVCLCKRQHQSYRC